MPWLLNEDAAVKKKLQGLTVTDANAPAGRPITVRYRLPETELADQTFPLIVINRNEMALMNEREHRGQIGLLYTPEQFPDWNTDAEQLSTTPYVVENPIPFDLIYQITVLARKEQHLISLAAQLAQQDRLPARFGFLEIPADGTTRSLFLDGGPEFVPGKDGDDKRLFQMHYTIRIPTELIPSQITPDTKVQQVAVADLSLTVPTA